MTDPLSIESATLYESEEEEQHRDHTPVDSLVDLLVKKQPEPIFPLWQVQLEIQQLSSNSLDSGSSSQLSDCVVSHFELSLQPAKENFLSAFSRLLSQYEIVVTSFESLLKDERLRPYISRSKYDLLMMLEEKEGHSKERVKIWPDTHTLLHSYTPYHHTADYLKMILQKAMSRVERQSQVSAIIVACK